jgi:hypothetical protein
LSNNVLPRRLIAPVVIASFLLSLVFASAAYADWDTDNKTDLIGVRSGGELALYRSNGAGSWLTTTGDQIGAGWNQYSSVLAPGDFNGDGKHDLLARKPDGTLWMYRGNGAGSFLTWTGEQVGAGWDQFTAILTPGDFSGDGKADLLARKPDGTLLLYRGNGAGSWQPGTGEQIGAGWNMFNAFATPGEFSGDGKMDILARKPDGTLWLYRGNGAGGFIDYAGGLQVGTGWHIFDALIGGDFSGDGKPDVLARQPDGVLRMYRGNGVGGFVNPNTLGEQVGAGWNQLSRIVLVPSHYSTSGRYGGSDGYVNTDAEMQVLYNAMVADPASKDALLAGLHPTDFARFDSRVISVASSEALTTTEPIATGDVETAEATASGSSCSRKIRTVRYKNVLGSTLLFVKQEIKWCWRLGTLTYVGRIASSDTPGAFWKKVGSLETNAWGGKGNYEARRLAAQTFEFCSKITGCIKERTLTNDVGVTGYGDIYVGSLDSTVE